MMYYRNERERHTTDYYYYVYIAGAVGYIKHGCAATSTTSNSYYVYYSVADGGLLPALC